MKRIWLSLSLLAVLVIGCSGSERFSAGMSAYEKGDYGKAIEVWKPLAEAGEARSQNYLGKMYNEGKGVAVDQDLAFLWFNKAAVRGYGKAQYNLAVMHLNGIGTSVDYLEAYKWFKLAEKSGIEAAKEGLVLASENLTPEQIQGAGAAAESWQPES